MNRTSEEANQSSQEVRHISDFPNDMPLEDVFDYQGYQVVRREFFAHVQEPAITFNRYQIYVNSVCLKKNAGGGIRTGLGQFGHQKAGDSSMQRR